MTPTESGTAARCPRCAAEYTIYGASTLPVADAPIGADGRVEQDCYECSIQHGRSPTLWIPLAILFVVTFPVMWMAWTHFVGPVLVVAAALWYIGDWFRRKVLPRRRRARLTEPAQQR